MFSEMNCSVLISAFGKLKGAKKTAESKEGEDLGRALAWPGSSEDGVDTLYG